MTISSWLNFGHPTHPEGGLWLGKYFWLRLTTATRQCLCLSQRFSHLRSFTRWSIKEWTLSTPQLPKDKHPLLYGSGLVGCPVIPNCRQTHTMSFDQWPIPIPQSMDCEIGWVENFCEIGMRKYLRDWERMGIIHGDVGTIYFAVSLSNYDIKLTIMRGHFHVTALGTLVTRLHLQQSRNFFYWQRDGNTVSVGR